MQIQKWMKKRMKKESLLTLAILVLFSPGAMAERLPLTLDEAVSLALSNNRSIEQALWARESAASQLSEVRRQSGPTLRWSGQARHIGGASYAGSRRQHDAAVAQHRAYELGLVTQDADPSNYPSYNNEFSNSVSLSIPLYTGGRLEHQREARGYALNAADLTVENRCQEVRYNTRAAYYRALQYRDLIGVRQGTIKALQEHCNQVGLQLEVGNVAYYDLLATEVQLENARFSLVEAEGNYKKALHSLANLLGLPPRTELELQESPAYQHHGAALEDCLDYALTYRPDGIASEFALKQARAAKEAAKAGWRPTVTAALTESRAGEDAFRKNHSQNWGAGIGLEWNVFDNGVTAAQVQTAEAALRTAESRAAQTKCFGSGECLYRPGLCREEYRHLGKGSTEGGGRIPHRSGQVHGRGGYEPGGDGCPGKTYGSPDEILCGLLRGQQRQGGSGQGHGHSRVHRRTCLCGGGRSREFRRQGAFRRRVG